MAIKPLSQRWPVHKDSSESKHVDYLPLVESLTLPDMFKARVLRSPDAIAYTEYDAQSDRWLHCTWENAFDRVDTIRRALLQEGLSQGDRIGICYRNAINWAIFDLAALAAGLVVVPLSTDEPTETIADIIAHAEIELVIFEYRQQWARMAPYKNRIAHMTSVIIGESGRDEDKRVIGLQGWLDSTEKEGRENLKINPQDLATIVYTSGATGRPKGVMLSHENILSNIRAALTRIEILPRDRFLSHLPLSHMLERTLGHFLPVMTGSSIVYSRSGKHLAADMLEHKPTVLISVPILFERIYKTFMNSMQPARAGKIKSWLMKHMVRIRLNGFEFKQRRGALSPAIMWLPVLDFMIARKARQLLGGKLRVAISGAAPIPVGVSDLLRGFGVNVLQGYGLTETSPMVSGNSIQYNQPASVGVPLDGVELAIDSKSKELLVRGDNVMLGYLKDESGTREAIDEDGWFHTGDQALVEEGYLYITGRLKELIALSNGMKIAPAEIESALLLDPMIEQVMLIGDHRPWLSALVVLADGAEIDEAALLRRMRYLMRSFPTHAAVKTLHICSEPWSVINGLMTPTHKIKRTNINDVYSEAIKLLYS